MCLALINEIQNPPITKVGVMNLDSFFPAKDRFALAMRLNNLLAAPGFEAWMQGEPPLNAKACCTRPRASRASR